MKDPFAQMPDGDTLKEKCRAALRGEDRAKAYLRGVLQVLVRHGRPAAADVVRNVLRRAP